MSFKNTFCDKNRQTQKFVLNFKFSKSEFEIWILNVTNQMIVFSAQSNQDIGTRAITLASHWFPFQCSKVNKYEDQFFQCP